MEFKIRRSPIEFSMELAEAIQDFLYRNIEKDLRFVPIPNYLLDKMGLEIKRFMCSLESYKTSPNPVVPLDFLIQGISDIKFASYLKSIRDKSFRYSEKFNPFEIPENYEYIPFVPIRDIGDIFNYNYWIFWKEDPVDDLKWGFVEVSKIPQKVLDEYKDNLNYILPYTVEEVKEEEILISSSGSACHNAGNDYVYLAKQEENYFDCCPLRGRRSLIYVSPDNVRDTIILPVQQSNSVKLIEQQCRLIAEKIQGSAYLRNEEEFQKLLDYFFIESFFFVDRDLKKEGITKPRELLMATLEVLEERYPDLPAFRYSGIFSNLYIIDFDGKEINPPRGHGLGMANALTTIIQCAIFEMIKSRMINEFGIDVCKGIGCLAYNDDFTARFPEEFLAEEYWDLEDSVLSDLQIIRNPSKSYKGRGSFSFCEVYFPRCLGEKISYRLNEFNQAFACCNISAAKLLVNSLSRIPYPGEFDKFMKELIAYWGYEFFYEEWNYPYIFGGWITPVINYIDLSFTDVDIINENMSNAITAVCESIMCIKKSKGKKRFVSPLETLYRRRDLHIPEKFDIFFNYNASIKEVESLYRLKHDDVAINSLFHQFYIKRKKIFKSAENFFQLGEAYQYVIDRFPEKDILPPERLILPLDVRLDTDGYNVDYIDPSVPNELLSVVKYFNPDKIPDNIVPFIGGINGKLYSKFKLSDGEYLSNSLWQHTANGSIETLSRIPKIILLEGNPSNYINPLQVCNACFFTYKRMIYPHHVQKREQKEEFEKYPNVELFLSSRKAKDLLLKLVAVIGFKKAYHYMTTMSHSDIAEIFIDVFDKTEIVDEPLIESSNLPEPDEYELRDFVRWRRDNCPILRNTDLYHIFSMIQIVREPPDNTLMEELETPANLIEWVRQHEITIFLTGGTILRPRETYVYITYIELDDDDESSEEALEILIDF